MIRWALTSSPTEFAGSSIVRITSICPLPKMLPDHALGGALDKIADVLRTGGSLVVVEFGWDRIDEATAEWALERLPAASPTEKPSWLGRRCQEWARGSRVGNTASAESYFAEWASEEGLHSSRRMRDELGAASWNASSSGCLTSTRSSGRTQ
jgi:hypothetical protein